MHKRYLITGATSGIGLELAKTLIKNGHSVIAFGRNFSELDKLEFENVNLIKKYVDLFEVEQIESIINQILVFPNKVDGFIHCGGIEETLPLSMYEPASVKKIFDVNLFCAIEILRVLSQKKMSNDGSSFVFISSVMGNLGQVGKLSYCASKSAILGVVRSAALELSKRRIRVNAVSPGLVETPMMYKMFEVLPKRSIETLKLMHPLGLGNVEDVTSLILFLLSDKSRWITGQNFVIDGGYSIQ